MILSPSLLRTGVSSADFSRLPAAPSPRGGIDALQHPLLSTRTQNIAPSRMDQKEKKTSCSQYKTRSLAVNLAEAASDPESDSISDCCCTT